VARSLGAALAHDAQMAAAGVTTVYDAIPVGTDTSSDKAYRAHIFAAMIRSIRLGTEQGCFRADHRIHLRCELPGPRLLDQLEPLARDPLVRLVSLMDHTPGQRQWRNLEQLKAFATGLYGTSETDFERNVARQMAESPAIARANRSRVTELFAGRGVPIATHDDTTEDHVAEAVADGASISEFPTSLVAARSAKRSGLATVAGAPNIVRGGSHSGGVAARELVEKSLLDGLSSDYVPASLLQAVSVLRRDLGTPIEVATSLVTWRVADMLRLEDRGRLKPALRADLVRFRFLGDTPVVRGVYSAGRPVF
jgi:alpha-D-ribose 1-methylphosphonate 5-triphosphate diphosphatase